MHNSLDTVAGGVYLFWCAMPQVRGQISMVGELDLRWPVCGLGASSWKVLPPEMFARGTGEVIYESYWRSRYGHDIFTRHGHATRGQGVSPVRGMDENAGSRTMLGFRIAIRGVGRGSRASRECSAIAP